MNIESLPTIEPALQQFANAKHGSNLNPFAVYIGIEHTEEFRAELKSMMALDQSDWDEASRSDIDAEMTFYDLQGHTLQEIYDFHIGLISDPAVTEPSDLPIEYHFFIAVLTKDWQKDGVLLINLQNPHRDDRVDGLVCPIGDIATICANLSVANVDFEDYVDQYAPERSLSDQLRTTAERH